MEIKIIWAELIVNHSISGTTAVKKKVKYVALRFRCSLNCVVCLEIQRNLLLVKIEAQWLYVMVTSSAVSDSCESQWPQTELLREKVQRERKKLN